MTSSASSKHSQKSQSDDSPSRTVSRGYVSAGLEIADLDDAFPHMIDGDTTTNSWPYLRQDISHPWYVDERNPTVGFVNRDEASILHNSAKMFKGKPCLEIGCWRGWSTAHIAAGSNSLVVFDPALTDPVFQQDVTASLEAAGLNDRVKLIGGSSPEDVESYSKTTGMRWSFVFIDGDHDGDAPRRDAELISHLAAPSSIVLLHDLMSPYVARGLLQLKALGWQVKLYMTTQIMGVAWRGDAAPLEHTPDLDQYWWLPAHLHGLSVSGAPQGFPFRKLEDDQWKSCTTEEAAAIASDLEMSLDTPLVTKIMEQDQVVRKTAGPHDSGSTDKLMQAFSGLQRENAALRSERDALSRSMETLAEELQLQQVRSEEVDKEVLSLRAKLIQSQEHLSSEAFATSLRLKSMQEKCDQLTLELETVKAALETAQATSDAVEATLNQTIDNVRSLTKRHKQREDSLLEEIHREREATALQAQRVATLVAIQEAHEVEMLDLQIELERTRQKTMVMRPSTAVSALEAAAPARLSSAFPSAQAPARTEKSGTGLRRALRRLTHRREAGIIKTIRLSGQFDPEWYLKKYPDVASAGADPVEHYVRHGAADNRDPSPAFSTQGYLRANQDVRKEGINPLLHYIRFGKAEGRQPR